MDSFRATDHRPPDVDSDGVPPQSGDRLAQAVVDAVRIAHAVPVADRLRGPPILYHDADADPCSQLQCPVPDDSDEKNGTYDLGGNDTVTLVDGAWQGINEYVGLVDFTFGELNNDGINDAAVSLSQNWGGTMWVEAVFIMLNTNGEPVQSAYRYIAEGTGRVSSMTIRRGQIILEESLHDVDDCNHCFSIRAVEVMQLLSNGHLGQRRLSTIYLPDQVRREIDITGPAEVTAVSCSVRVQGTVSDYAVEQHLYYAIWSMNDEVLAFDSFAFTDDGTNPGGTIDLTIDLTMIPAGEFIMVGIYEADFELSSPDPMVDAFVQYINAMDSVVVQVI